MNDRPYLSIEEYKEMHFQDVGDESFHKLVETASDVLDMYTRHFYRKKDLETDDPFRKEKFKKAVGSQIGYMHENGSTTTNGMQIPASVTLGRTTLSQASRQSSTQAPTKELLCPDVYLYLQGTGLLYRGI